MSRRIEVELTSSRDDGTWTWRAAGAREPKGVVDGQLLYPGAKVGDVVRADADFEIEGITITAVHPPQRKAEDTTNRIELLPRDFTPVTTSLVGRERRGPRDRRGDRGDRERRGPRGDRPARGERAPRREGPATERAQRERPAREQRPRPERARGDTSKQAPERRDRRRRRLTPGHAHRDALISNLPAEQQPIAEQLFRGGLPAVRRAVDEQNAKARADGRPEVHPEGLLAIAEQLLPGVRSAEWRDRAEAAAGQLDDLALRDLRSVVAGADVARDDESRALATKLREALEARVTKLRENWLSELTKALADGRVQRALTLAARPADPATRFPGDLAVKLSEAASQALAPDTPPREWAALLEAVAESPVRRTVKPAGLPREATEEVIQIAHRLAGRVPAVAGLLGIDMPPPPGPVRPSRPPKPPRRPPAPTRPPAAVPEPTPESTSGSTPPPTPERPAPIPSPQRPPTPAPIPPPTPERPTPVPPPTPERPPAPIPPPTPERPTPVPPPTPERPPAPVPEPTPTPEPPPPAPQPEPAAGPPAQPAPPPPPRPETGSEPSDRESGPGA